MKASTFLRGLFLCTISGACAFAQAPSADLQELKAKLQQLEVMMRSLQDQIAAVERTQKAQATQAPRVHVRIRGKSDLPDLLSLILRQYMP